MYDFHNIKCHRRLHTCVMCLQKHVGHLPEDVQNDPQQLGSLLYSCVTLAHEEEQIMKEALPESAFQVQSVHQVWPLIVADNA